MSAAFWNWTEPIQFNIVTTTAVDFEAKDTLVNQVVFDGTIEPIAPQKLWIKPEGERKWKYWTLWTEQDLIVGAIILDEHGKFYRVSDKSDWRQGDYQQYEIVQAPKPSYPGA
jgi:hypothetical protein